MSLDDTILWLRAVQRITGAKRHTRLGILGPHYIQVRPTGLLEHSDFRGYDGLVRLHGTTSNKEGEMR